MEEHLYISPLAIQFEDRTAFNEALNIFKRSIDKQTTTVRSPDTILGTYNIITYDEYIKLDPDYRFHRMNKKWYILFKPGQFIEAMRSIPRKLDSYQWSRFDQPGLGGYEVTSKGDRRFSPLYMYLDNGITIEEYYHLDLKGYRKLGYTNWMDIKGLPPLDDELFSAKVRFTYVNYLRLHPSLLYELAVIGAEVPFTDMFDVQGGQNKLYSEILNDYYSFNYERMFNEH